MIVSSKRRKQTALKRSTRGNRPSGPLSTGNSVSLVRAPAAVSTARYLRSLSFSAVRLGDRIGCRITGNVPFITVGAEVTSGDGFVTRTGSRYDLLAFSPVNAAFLCPQLARLASCFTQYRWTSLGFKYNAMGSTASAVRLCFAYSADYLSPALTTGAGYEKYNYMLTTQNSQVFSPWMDWSMSVPGQQELCYVATFSDTIAANSRQSYGGVIACVSDSDPGTTYTYGVISLAFVLDLFDPVPLVTPPSAELSGPSKALVAEGKAMSVQEPREIAIPPQSSSQGSTDLNAEMYVSVSPMGMRGEPGVSVTRQSPTTAPSAANRR